MAEKRPGTPHKPLRLIIPKKVRPPARRKKNTPGTPSAPPSRQRGYIPPYRIG